MLTRKSALACAVGLIAVVGGCKMAAQMVDGWISRQDPARLHVSAQETVIEAAKGSPSERVQAQAAAAEAALR